MIPESGVNIVSSYVKRVLSLRVLWLGLCVWVGLTSAMVATAAEPALLQQAAHAYWIAEGHGNRVVYVIFDPDCPYCHMVYVDSQMYLKHYQFRWVPVAILTPRSAGKAAAMIEASDPQVAFRENEDHFVRARGKLGGIKPLAHISAATRQRLAQNEVLLKKTGVEVVPTIVFLNTKGKVRIIKGAPAKADFSEVMARVGKTGAAS